jgi:hypothetical protein
MSDYDKKKRRGEVVTSPRLVGLLCLSAALYVHGSHLCVAHYPKSATKIGKKSIGCITRTRKNEVGVVNWRKTEQSGTEKSDKKKNDRHHDGHF